MRSYHQFATLLNIQKFRMNPDSLQHPKHTHQSKENMPDSDAQELHTLPIPSSIRSFLNQNIVSQIIIIKFRPSIFLCRRLLQIDYYCHFTIFFFQLGTNFLIEIKINLEH